MAQGFVQSLNLFESNTRDKDSSILDNLGGTGISEDIALFTNNLRNVDLLRPGDIDSTDPTTTVFRVTGDSKIAFTNGTLITINGVEYKVTNSNAETKFELERVSDSVKLTVGELDGNLVRSTAVTFENISNLNPQAYPTIAVPIEEIQEAQQAFTKTERQALLAELRTADYKGTGIGYLVAIDEYNSRFEYLKDIATFKNEQTTVQEEFRIKNSIFITNKDDVDVTSDDAPGAFISNAYGQVARVGGNNINPWDLDGTKTTTVSESTSIGNLVVENPRFDGVPVAAIQEGPAINFTHRIPVVINDTEYNLLCTDGDLSQNIIELYTLTADKIVADEGVSVRIDLETSGVSDGVQVAYSVTGVDEDDINPGSSPLIGNFTITNNKSFVLFSIAEDGVSEGTETLSLALDNGRDFIDVQINDTSTTPANTDPVYTLTPDVTVADEGTTIVIGLTTQFVDDGPVNYTISGIQDEDITDGILTGTFNLVSGEAQIALTLVEDGLTEGTETLTMTLNDSGTSIDIDINDTSIGLTPTFEADYTINVTSSGFDYILSGTDRNGVVSGTYPELAFNNGDRVKFNVDATTTTNHPFYIKTVTGAGTGNQAPGAVRTTTTTTTIEWTTQTAGTFYYQCSIHENMNAPIVIS